jgi:hypothetical protein
MDLGRITPLITTKNQKVLSIYFPPPVNYSLYAAVRLSILLANPKTHDWFYSNFIQLHFEDLIVNPVVSDHHLNIFPIEYMKAYDYCGAALFLQETFVDEKVIPVDKKTLIPAMVGWIDQGFYVISRVDVSKLPGTRHYRGRPSVHTVFFYGYDLQQKIFHHLDFNEKGDLTPIDVRFEDYLTAFFSRNLPGLFKEKRINSQYHITLCNVKPQSKLQFQLDPECIKALLTDYLHSTNTSKRFHLFVPEAKGVYGLSIYQALIDFTVFMARSSQSVDYRTFHALYEHKQLMVERLLYLESLGIIDSTLRLSERFNKIAELSDILRHLAIKYNVTKNDNLIPRMIAMIENILELEQPLIGEIIGCL